jgi:hypothetical protein
MGKKLRISLKAMKVEVGLSGLIFSQSYWNYGILRKVFNENQGASRRSEA